MPRNIYVDNCIRGGGTETEVWKRKTRTIPMFRLCQFCLIKWYRNVKAFEKKSDKDIIISSDQTYAKEQFGAKENETKILGLN